MINIKKSFRDYITSSFSKNEGIFKVYIHICLSAIGVLNSREELCIYVHNVSTFRFPVDNWLPIFDTFWSAVFGEIRLYKCHTLCTYQI